MSPLLTSLVNMGIVLTFIAGWISSVWYGYRQGCKDTRAEMNAERRREEAQKALEEDRKAYPSSYAVSE